MHDLSRRTFLTGAAAGTAGVLLVPRWAGATLRLAGPSAIPGEPFTLGVASGDPTPSRVVIWTRLAPDPLAGGGMGPADESVDWEVAADEAFAEVVASGTTVAAAAHAHSVHVDVTGLEPDTWYWYRFRAGGYESPVGRTRTLPAPGSSPSSMSFGFASCQNWTNGYYPAHGHLAEEDLDLVFHLGDYIYEGGGAGVRAHNSPEVTTLPAYRNRYALYKGDPNLQASHAAFPWVVVWDDHEVDNNYAGAISEDNVPEAVFLARRAAAYKAWWEHQPVRLPPPTGPDLAIHRGFAWGDLASVFALDTRQYRSDQVCSGDPSLGGIGPPCADLDDPGRSILGDAQQQWLLDGLGASRAVWNVVAQQVVFAAMPVAGNYNFDQWDGYPASRRAVVEAFARPDVRNPVVITGDIHASGVATVHRDGEDPTTPAVATELVGTSISSGFPSELTEIGEALIGGLDWVHYVNARQRGYVRVRLDRDRLVADFRVVSTVAEPEATVSTDFTWTVEADAPIPSGPGAQVPVDEPTPLVAQPRFTG